MGSEQNKWVVIFLIYADFIKNQNSTTVDFETAYATELDALIKDITELNFNDTNTDIFVIYGSLNFIKSTTTQPALTSTVHLFEVKKATGNNVIKYWDKVENEVIKDPSPERKGRFSLQRSEELALALGKISSRYSDKPDTRFILNCWDHGSVFGIFKAEKHPLMVQSFPDITEAMFPNLFRLIDQIPGINKIPAAPPPEKADLKKITMVIDNVVYSTYTTPAKQFALEELFQKGDFEITHDKELHFILPNTHFDEKKFHKKFGTLDINEIADPETKEAALNDLNGFAVTPEGILEILTNEELARAITKAFKDPFEKLDLLVMMNCWMMNLHTIYALRESVHYFIAPQGGISSPGYDYKKVVEFLGSNFETLDAAKKYIDSCYDFSASPRKDIIPEIESWGVLLAKIDKTAIEGLVLFVNEFFNSLFTEISKGADVNLAVKHFILYYAKTCFVFSQKSRYYQIDLLNLIRIFRQYNQDIKNNRILRQFRTGLESEFEKALKQIIIYDFEKVKNVYAKYINVQDSPFLGVNIYPPNGASLYFPFEANGQSAEHRLFLLQDEEKKLCDEIATWQPLINILTN